MPDADFVQGFEEPEFTCPSCEKKSYDKSAYVFYSLARAAYCSLIGVILLTLAWAALIYLHLLQDASIMYLGGVCALIFLLITGTLFYKKRLAISITRKIYPVTSGITNLIFSSIKSGIIFAFIYLALLSLNIRSFDLWLLAALSLVWGFRSTILLIKPISSALSNTSYIRAAAAFMILCLVAPYALLILFIVVILLAASNLYTINPLLDILVSLLVLTAISSFAFFLKKKQPPARNVL